MFYYVLECLLFMSGSKQASLVCVDSIDEFVIGFVRETPFQVLNNCTVKLFQPQAAQMLFVIYIRDSIALRSEPFKENV